jgi:hypothetical protein
MARTEISVAEALSRAHQALLNDLAKLKDSLNQASGQGLQALCTQLNTTRKHILEHFRFEEQDGYMEKVRKREPRLEHTIELLAGEHQHLARSLDLLIAKAGDAQSLDNALRESVREWIGTVRQHEIREDELVQDVFNMDISAED